MPEGRAEGVRSGRKLGGVLKCVLDTITGLKERGFWVEIVTLVVPGFNDDPKELREIARFICSVSPDVPYIFAPKDSTRPL